MTFDPNKKNERKSERSSVEILVEFKYKENVFNNFSFDLSEGGMFIETENLIKVNEIISLNFKLIHENTDFEIKARVAWIRNIRQENKKRGMGVEFIFNNNKQKEILNRTILLVNKVKKG